MEDTVELKIWLTNPDAVTALKDGKAPNYGVTETYSDMSTVGWVLVGKFSVQVKRPTAEAAVPEFIINLCKKKDGLYADLARQVVQIDEAIGKLQSLTWDSPAVDSTVSTDTGTIIRSEDDDIPF